MRVLITGGGCVEPIDDVRAITNSSTGKTALQIARVILAKNPAAAITLLQSERAVQPSGALAKKIVVKNFRSCADLKKLLQAELCDKPYDLIFHAAAVSDYTVKSVIVDGKEFAAGKVHKISGAADVHVNLKLNPKLLQELSRLAKKKNAAARVVGFKLTSGASGKEREAAVQKLFSAKNPPDFVLSNDLSEITAKSHPCVLWGKGGTIARGQIKSLVRKIYDIDC